MKEFVCINLDEYNRLRDFEREIKDGNTYEFAYGFMRGFVYISTDESVKKLLKECKVLVDKVNELEIQQKQIKDKAEAAFQKMSVWEFFKNKLNKKEGGLV